MRTMLVVGILWLTISQTAVISWGQRRPGAAAASVAVITRTINDCENTTDRFVKTLRRALNDSRLDNSGREADLNRSARELERSMDRVGESWNRDKDIAKTRTHVRRALTDARNINASMTRRRLNPDCERDWREVRAQLNLLARAFDLPSVNW